MFCCSKPRRLLIPPSQEDRPAAVEDQRHESQSRLAESARTRAKTNADQSVEVGAIIARLEAKSAEMEAVKKEVEAVLTETQAYETGKDASSRRARWQI